jgi:hypothetical protein
MRLQRPSPAPLTGTEAPILNKLSMVLRVGQSLSLQGVRCGSQTRAPTEGRGAALRRNPGARLCEPQHPDNTGMSKLFSDPDLQSVRCGSQARAPTEGRGAAPRRSPGARLCEPQHPDNTGMSKLFSDPDLQGVRCGSQARAPTEGRGAAPRRNPGARLCEPQHPDNTGMSKLFSDPDLQSVRCGSQTRAPTERGAEPRPGEAPERGSVSRSTPITRGCQSCFQTRICKVSAAGHRPALRLRGAGPRPGETPERGSVSRSTPITRECQSCFQTRICKVSAAGHRPALPRTGSCRPTTCPAEFTPRLRTAKAGCKPALRRGANAPRQTGTGLGPRVKRVAPEFITLIGLPHKPPFTGQNQLKKRPSARAGLQVVESQ